MKNLYQYEHDGHLHIEYAPEDGGTIKVMLSDDRITIHGHCGLEVAKKYANRIDIVIQSPPPAPGEKGARW